MLLIMVSGAVKCKDLSVHVTRKLSEKFSVTVHHNEVGEIVEENTRKLNKITLKIIRASKRWGLKGSR